MTTDYNPYNGANPITIRDATAAIIRENVPDFTKVMTGLCTRTTDIVYPYCSIYHNGETIEPVGEANSFCPAFHHELSLIVEIMTDANNEAQLELNGSNLVEKVKLALFTNSEWLELFEGFVPPRIQYLFKEDAEEFALQVEMELRFFFRSEWPPILPNELEQVMMQMEVNKDKYGQSLIREIDF